MFSKYLVLLVTLLIIFMSMLSFSCGIHVTPAYSVEVQNNSDRTVVIFVRLFMNGKWDEVTNFGKVEPGSRRAVFAMVAPTSKSKDKRYLVEARDLDGKLIKSWEFPFHERVLLVIDKNDVP